MIQRSSLSIRGLYHWDNTLFDNLVLPNGISKDVLVSNLLSELGELEVLYPNSRYMKEMIGYWSQKQLPTWEKWNAELLIEYDPINNYKKHTTHSGTKSDTNTRNDRNNKTNNVTKSSTDNNSSSKDTDTSVTDSKNQTSTDKVKAYNEQNNFVDYKQDIMNSTGNNDTETHETGQETKTRSETNSETGENIGYRQDVNNGTNAFTRDVTGNVGIRSYQSLLEEELNLRDRYNIYNLIIKDFKLRFCLLLY